MPLTSTWNASGLGRGLCLLHLRSSRLSGFPASLFLTRPVPVPTSRIHCRPSRRTLLGAANQLQPYNLSQHISTGLPPASYQLSLASSRDMLGSARSSEAPPVLAPPAMSTASAGRGSSPALQQQPQPPAEQPEIGAPASPSSIHLTVASGAVVAPELDYTVVLDMLHKNASANPDASKRGGVVLGMTSPTGPTESLDVVIGQLNFKRLLACARNKLWWMTPEWRTATWALPPETQFLLAEMAPAGPYALLLPLIDGDFRATLRSPAKKSEGQNGELVLRLESGATGVTGARWNSALYVAASWDPYELVDRGVAAAAALSGGARPRTTKELPASLDGFGWCTWDAFYSTVSARGLAEGLSSLEDGGVSPQLLIIDDGWQMTEVDPPLRKTPAADLADRLHVEGEPRRLLEATQDEFFYESQEVMADTAAQLPPGTSAGNVMPTLANLGPQHLASAASTPNISNSQSANALDAPANPLVAPAASAPARGAVDASGVGLRVADAVSTRRSATQAAATRTSELMPSSDGNNNAISNSTGKGGLASSAIAIWLARASQKVAGWVMGIATAAFLIFYQWVVEPAPPNSMAVRAFAGAAKGLLRPAMLSFYANASDFTRRLTSVRANGKFSHPDAGPETDWAGVHEALHTVVAHIKRKFGVRYVYCWHGLPGYWAGVMPTDDGTAGGGAGVPGLKSHLRYAAPTQGVLEIEPSMAWNPAVLAGIGVVEDPNRLYSAMHAYLQHSGVDGVKVDCQAGVGLIGSAMGGGAALSAAYQAALERSVAEHFSGNHVINCMCHSTENIYRMTSTAVARASDDFYPRDPASSHPHIAACAFNSLFLGALLQPDWDMFHSKHPAARLHAVARAVSGGPVYVSDKPGEHDFALLHTLVLPDGSVLRCERPGRPTRDCLFEDVLRDGKSLLKVWNTNPVTGVVGVFHLQGSSWDRIRRKFHVHDKAPRQLTTQVRPYDVDAFRPVSTGTPAGRAAGSGASAAGSPAPSARGFCVFSRNSGGVALLHGDEAVQVSLRGGEADILTVARVTRVGPVAVAPLGLANMVNGGGAVRSVRYETVRRVPAAVTGGGAVSGFNSQELVFSLTIRGHGELLCYCSREPDTVLLNGGRLQQEVSYSYGAGVVVQPVEAGAAGVGGEMEVAEGGRLRVDLPRVSDLENEVQLVFRSFD